MSFFCCFPSKVHAVTVFSKSTFAIADSIETHLCKAEGPSFKTYFSYDVENNTLKAFFLTQYSNEKLEAAYTDEETLWPYSLYFLHRSLFLLWAKTHAYVSKSHSPNASRLRHALSLFPVKAEEHGSSMNLYVPPQHPCRPPSETGKVSKQPSLLQVE